MCIKEMNMGKNRYSISNVSNVLLIPDEIYRPFYYLGLAPK